jgi:hypothetical protein
MGWDNEQGNGMNMTQLSQTDNARIEPIFIDVLLRRPDLASDCYCFNWHQKRRGRVSWRPGGAAGLH